MKKLKHYTALQLQLTTDVIKIKALYWCSLIKGIYVSLCSHRVILLVTREWLNVLTVVPAMRYIFISLGSCCREQIPTSPSLLSPAPSRGGEVDRNPKSKIFHVLSEKRVFSQVKRWKGLAEMHIDFFCNSEWMFDEILHQKLQVNKDNIRFSHEHYGSSKNRVYWQKITLFPSSYQVLKHVAIEKRGKLNNSVN